MPVGSQNVRTNRYRALLGAIPRTIQTRADEAFAMFCNNPAHPSLRLHELDNNAQGSHLPGSYSVTINMQYRAIAMSTATAMFGIG